SQSDAPEIAGVEIRPLAQALSLDIHWARDVFGVFTETDQVRLVFVDGVFDPSQSDAPEIAGVEIRPLAQALSLDIHWARDVFGV
ncbi:hypothetical protein CNY89_28735, partial [Amaricoccus sp. HAR-UPW-R2A-40]